MRKILFPVIILFIFLIIICSLRENMNKQIRPAFFAGKFYPDNKEVLKEKIDSYLKDIVFFDENEEIRAIIAPHAGYDFSGPVAAHSFAAIRDRKIKTVFLIGNSHTKFFDGVAVDESDLWQTPLGEVEVDKKTVEKLVKENKFINLNLEVHAKDHVLEVQLPFLQVVLGKGFKIVPMLFGNYHDDNFKDLVEVLKKNLSKDDLLVVSSDFSHYPPYEEANDIDADTLEIIIGKNISELEKHMFTVMSSDIPDQETLICAPDAIKTLMRLAGIFDWEGKILEYKNSGDSFAGDKNGVVGYGAVIFKQKEGENKNEKENSFNDLINKDQKKELLKIAKETVEEFVKNKKIRQFNVSDERLNALEGVFVTIYNNKKLRGCIGQIVSSGASLWQNVRDMAIAAASEDDRFLPIEKSELSSLDYEISVLSQPKEISDWKKVELGKHGVIVSKGFNKGVFLPQVADETGWSLEEFLSHLCHEKAGLPPDCYKNDPKIKLEVFTAQVLGED